MSRSSPNRRGKEECRRKGTAYAKTHRFSHLPLGIQIPQAVAQNSRPYLTNKQNANQTIMHIYWHGYAFSWELLHWMQTHKVPGIQKGFNPGTTRKLALWWRERLQYFVLSPGGNQQRNEITLSGKSFPDLFSPYQREVILVKLFKPFIKFLLTQGMMSSWDICFWGWGGGPSSEEFQGEEFSAELKIVGTWKRLVPTQGTQWTGCCRGQGPGRSTSVANGLEMNPSYIRAIEFREFL